MNTTLPRNQTADTLKGLAVIFMIQVHIMEQFASFETNNSLFGKISYFLGGPFCAPVFVAVMGYFLATSDKPFLYFFKRGGLLFLGGILLNIGRSVHLFICIFQRKYDLDPWFYILGADILPMAGLSVVLLALIRSISRKSLLLFVPLIILFASLNSYTNISNHSQGYFLSFFAGNSDFSYFPLFPWFSYVLAGYIFKIIYDKYKKYLTPFTSIHWVLTGLLCSGIIFFMPYSFKISTDLAIYYHHDFNFFLWVIGFMIIYTLLINALVKILKNTTFINYLAWTGKNVTVIYCIQWLIIGNIATAIYHTQNILQSELWFIAITVSTCIIVFVFYKVKDKLTFKVMK